jgi:ribosomal subunit interface protein
MEILIEAPFTIKANKKEMIEEKVKGLERYNVKMTKAKIFFKLDDGDRPNVVLAEILVHVKGPDVFAKATADTDMEAFNKAASQVERQLRDRKDKRTDKHKQKLWNPL